MAWVIGNAQNSPGTLATAATSATLTAPTGITNGDLLFAMVATDISTGGDPGAATITGFTQITSHYTPVGFHGSIRLTTLYKIASSESGNYTATWPTAARAAWGIVDLSGNVSASPVDVSATNNSTVASTTSLVAPALTGLVGSSDLLLCCFANPGGGNPYTMPAGMTTIFSNNQPNTDSTFLGLAYSVLTSNANTSSQTMTASGGDVYEAASVALLAGGGGGGGSPAIGADSVAVRSGAMQIILMMRDRLIEPAAHILRPRPQFAT